MSATTDPRRSAGTTRAQLLARIHCLKKDFGWSDDEYRDILQGVSGKRSAAELDFAGLARAVAMLGGKPVRVNFEDRKDDGEWSFLDRAAEEKKPLLKKIYMVCKSLGAGKHYAEGVARRQSEGVARKLEMMSRNELYRCAQALVNTQRVKREAKASAQEVSA